MNDLNVIHAAALACVHDRGVVRRGPTQGELDVISDGAVAIRDGVVVAVGDTRSVLAAWGQRDIPTIEAVGKTVIPGLVECHSHPIFDGERHDEYAERLGGASLADVAAKGGGIWRSSDDGTSWQSTGLSSGTVLSLAIDTAGALYAGTSSAGAVT